MTERQRERTLEKRECEERSDSVILCMQSKRIEWTNERTKRSSRRNSLNTKKRRSRALYHKNRCRRTAIELKQETYTKTCFPPMPLLDSTHFICTPLPHTWAEWKQAALNEEIPTHNRLFYLRYFFLFFSSIFFLCFFCISSKSVRTWLHYSPSDIIIRITHSVHFMFRSFGM